MSLNKEILKKSEELFPFMQAARRQFHKYPEVGMKEFKTAEYVKEKLDEMGIPYRDKVGGTGVVGLIEGNAPGKCIALRADMDALTIQEANDVEYASKIDGIMHACGHDAHTAILLGTAKLLNGIKDKFKGSVKLLFQPAEEGPGGAEPMVKDGALENPPVDAAVALHVSSARETGLMGISEGVNHAAMCELDITVTGVGGHAAYPHRSVDAIVIAARVVCELQTIISRMIDPMEPAVITIGKINGGYRRNIIADKIEMLGTIRYLNEETGDLLKTNIEGITAEVCKSMGGDYKVVFGKSYPPLVNDKELAQKIKGYLGELLGEEKLFPVEKPTMGAEDFAYFAREVPSVFMRLGSGGKNEEYSHPHHHPNFDLDEQALITGCAAFSKISVEFLNESM